MIIKLHPVAHAQSLAQLRGEFEGLRAGLLTFFAAAGKLQTQWTGSAPDAFVERSTEFAENAKAVDEFINTATDQAEETAAMLTAANSTATSLWN